MASGLAVCLPLAMLAARASLHDGPEFVEAPGPPAPIWAFGLSLASLLMLFGASVFVVRQIVGSRPSWPGSSRPRSVLMATALVVPGALIAGCVLSEVSGPGCGDPRVEILEPLPPGVEVVRTRNGSIQRGPERWLELEVEMENRTPDSVARHLAEVYRRRGWSMELVDDGGYVPHGPEWRLEARVASETSYETSERSYEPLREVQREYAALTLAHVPDDDRTCHNW